MSLMRVTRPIIPARWRAEFLSQISKVSSPEFVLTTLHRASSSNEQPSYVPRARFCIFRGMWAELPVHRNNQAELNEKTYQSELITFTTDMRMLKVPDILGNETVNGDLNMSGGGGPVEAVFWIKESGTQWRIRGEAFIVGNDIDDESSSGARFVKKALGERMRLVNGDGEDQWSWSRELVAHFGNLSPSMRGTFKNPPPGIPMSVPLSDPRLKLGEDVADLCDELARKNFRVVIIKPSEVEKLDLSVPSEARRRWLYTYVGSKNNDQSDWWTEEECWP